MKTKVRSIYSANHRACVFFFSQSTNGGPNLHVATNHREMWSYRMYDIPIKTCWLRHQRSSVSRQTGFFSYCLLFSICFVVGPSTALIGIRVHTAIAVRTVGKKSMLAQIWEPTAHETVSWSTEIRVRAKTIIFFSFHRKSGCSSLTRTSVASFDSANENENDQSRWLSNENILR